jgi:hypothetical protein
MLRALLDKAYAELEKKGSQAKTSSSTSPLLQENPGFKIRFESKLPQGFPEPGPLGRIVVKQYPVYRSAEIGGEGMQNVAFMRLFNHIQSNKISMTTPVVMDLDPEQAQRKSMAFLYQSTELGSLGLTDSGVKVSDQPAGQYVSLGLSGRESKKLLKEAITLLENWLQQNPEYSSAGQPRLLGYNSPMVPDAQRYLEIQIPVKKT